MRRLIPTLCLLLTACGPDLDYGQCLQSHVRQGWMQLIPITNGKTTSFMYVWHDDEDVCDQWEYPEGRPMQKEAT
jgi:hypothetical protein